MIKPVESGELDGDPLMVIRVHATIQIVDRDRAWWWHRRMENWGSFPERAGLPFDRLATPDGPYSVSWSGHVPTASLALSFGVDGSRLVGSQSDLAVRALVRPCHWPTRAFAAALETHHRTL